MPGADTTARSAGSGRRSGRPTSTAEVLGSVSRIESRMLTTRAKMSGRDPALDLADQLVESGADLRRVLRRIELQVQSTLRRHDSTPIA